MYLICLYIIHIHKIHKEFIAKIHTHKQDLAKIMS